MGYARRNAGTNEGGIFTNCFSSHLLHATGGVLPSIEGVTFSTDQDPVNGTVRIFVDPVTRPDGLKSASGGYDFVDANGPP